MKRGVDEFREVKKIWCQRSSIIIIIISSSSSMITQTTDDEQVASGLGGGGVSLTTPPFYQLFHKGGEQLGSQSASNVQVYHSCLELFLLIEHHLETSVWSLNKVAVASH
ncbi:uncharacterized protein LOC120351443 [Nilaparvata lugens]|uniref:uncharacterized protein LOC120351443 n=1 Tax=Nilaparvata lugens TaxID=108931 RepID=UPI00193E03A9|nr:uncharacterized protein LOC120351443 [Nilaparvata lugens]